MRVGTRTDLGRKWAPQGHRPQAMVKIGYEFTHLFVAIAPFTGKIFAMFLPSLNNECFQIFGQQLQQGLSQKTLLIADQATAHQQKLLDQEWIVLEKLPPASPELNPVERFFKELRRKLKFRVFDSIKHAEQEVEKILLSFFENPQAVISLTLYPYIKNTA